MAEALSDLLAEGLGINDDPSVSYVDFMEEYVRFASLPSNQRSSPPKEFFNASIRVKAVETLFERLSDLSSEEIEEELTVLASKHLPQLARAIRLVPLSLPVNIWSEFLLSDLHTYPIFARFIRTHPEGPLLQEHLLKLLGLALPESVAELVQWTTSPKHLTKSFTSTSWLVSLCVTTAQIPCHLHPSSPPPPTERLTNPPNPNHLSSRLFKISEDLLQFLDRANGTLSGGPAQAELRAVADGMFFSGFVLIGGFENKGSEKPLRDIRESLAWTRCEGGKEALEMGKARGGCKEGEEMMSCSRCKTVRYCSAQHQKLDWKRHKPLCQAPNW